MSEDLLYKPIEDMFIKKGHFSISARKKFPSERVHSSFGVNVHGAPKKIDVVAFRAADGDIEAKAVECKPGKTWEAAGEALGQATAYQRLFPEVYVATQANEESLKHVESLLRELGLGYISVKEDGEAEEIFPPSHNIRFNQKEYELQVKGKAIALLACHDVLGSDNFQFGRADKPGQIWVSSLEPCNISCSIEEGEIFWFVLNIESKHAVQQIFSKVEFEELYKLLSNLPSGYEIRLWKFLSYRPKRYDEEETMTMLTSKLKLHDVTSYIDKIKEWNWEAHVQIGKNYVFDVLLKDTFASKLKEIMSGLSPLQVFLNNLVR